MTHEAAERTTSVLRDRLGDRLRTVVVVTPEGNEPVYVRSDLRERYDRAEFTEVVDAMRLDGDGIGPATDGLPVGERRAIVHYHEHAFVLQIPMSQGTTLLVSVSPDAGRNLRQFVEACRRVVDDVE